MLLMRCSLVGALGLGVWFPLPSSAKVSRSSVTEGVDITYRQTDICETTPGVSSYSGYVTLAPSALQPYAQKVFFWFFEARNDPEQAPLVVWLQGGPGAPSIDQALGENGPCIVQADSNTTILNEWSWNNHANLLYIDQPVQTGFSYDEVTPGLVNIVTGDIMVGDGSDPSNYTAVNGNFASQDPSRTANTTAVAADAIWNFLQIWMAEFDEYRRDKISVWSQSYGGHYGPAVANLLQTRSTSSELCQNVGIISGFIDFLVQGEHFPNFAINNTYGIEAYDVEISESAAANFTMQGGCRDQIEACRAMTPNGYRDQHGANETVSELCGGAFLWCWNNVYAAYEALSGRDPFDIAQIVPTAFPPPYAFGYLSQAWVMKALGARVNYTQTNNVVTSGFIAQGDFVYGGFSDDIGSLLDSGVRVTLLHGDRDFRCNWVAGEALALAVKYGDKAGFAAAGYAEVVTNSSYVGGMVRQYDNFAFTRVFQAGHAISYYQPETAYQIFTRTILGNDVATGSVSLAETSGYATRGPSSVFNITNEVLPSPAAECYVLAFPLTLTCTEEQIGALQNGTAIVQDHVVVSPAGNRA